MTSVHLFLTARATIPDAWLTEEVRKKRIAMEQKIKLSNKNALLTDHILSQVNL